MNIGHLLSVAAVTAMIGGAAFAQSTSTTATTSPSAATGQAVSTSTTTTDANGAQVTTTLTTNGPVPDTPQNRAKYGQPMSHAGKRTAPRGN